VRVILMSHESRHLIRGCQLSTVVLQEKKIGDNIRYLERKRDLEIYLIKSLSKSSCFTSIKQRWRGWRV